MSTMLRSINPEAAGEAEGTDRDRRVPYAGQVVLWNPRPGEGRSGRLTTPALVTRVVDEDHVDLLILWDADDSLSRWNVPRKNDQNNVNAWSFTDWDQDQYHPHQNYLMSWKDVGTHQKRIAELDAEVAELKKEVAEIKKLPRAVVREQKKKLTSED